MAWRAPKCRQAEADIIQPHSEQQRSADRLPVYIRGTGMYVPERVVENEYFVARLDTSDEWITTRTGIRQRRWVADDECTSTMATRASAAALKDAGLTIDDIDVIVCATATGDCPFPATACFVQAALGAGSRNIPALDVSAACAGFVFGSIMAAGLIASRQYDNALVIGAETLSRYANPEDRGTCILFGDAAGAAVWSRTRDPERGILYSELGSDGTRAEHIWVPAGGSRLPTSHTTVAEHLQYLHMRGREVYRFAVVKMQELIDRALDATGVTADELKLLIPHQSNLRIIESVRQRLGLPREKVAVHIDRYGNTSAASIVMSLHEAKRDGTLHDGDVVLLVAIGAGLTWGVMVVRL